MDNWHTHEISHCGNQYLANPQSQKLSRLDSLIERFALIKERYGDEYPIVLYEPSIKCQEKKALKDLIQGNNSIHLFDNFKEAFKFVQFLDISFILIVSEEMDEKIVLENFGSSVKIYGRPMFDLEEETLLKDIFCGISEDLIKSLKLKAYVFITWLDFRLQAPLKEDEEEVMAMCDLKDMAQEFRHDFVVIWYDPKIDAPRKSKLEEDLGMKIEEKNIFLDFSELYQRMKNYTGSSYHLIVSRRDKAEKILDEIESFKDLLGLYIYDHNLQKILIEKVEIQKTIEELVPKIKEGFRTKSKLINTFPSFATNFDAADKSHTYFLHYYLKGLINFKNRKQAKGDFVKLARKIYQDQDRLLEKFEATYGKYDGVKMLHWYTRDSPVYKLLNNCLRIASSDSILYSRFVLKDMEQAIRDQYQQYSKDFSGLVYRGAYISPEEWKKLERNLGEEIEMYGFLSTTVNQRIAVNFFRGDMNNKIFITIIVPSLPELDEQGFADVSQFSEFKGEKEILFNVRSRFRILEARVSKIDNRGTKGRHLVLLYGAGSLRKYMTKHQPAITMELQLPPENQCNQCGSTKELFAFQQETTEVRCLDCLIKNFVPQDTPLFALDSENKTNILKGKLLKFNQTYDFSNSGYQCFHCQITGKEKYYKWIDPKTSKHIVQCSDCFKNKKTSASYQILFAETSPYTLWQEYQAEWEKVDSDYQAEVSETVKYEDQGNVFEMVQKFDLCLEYGKKVLNRWMRRRWKEKEKFESFFTIGRGNQLCGKHQQALIYFQEYMNMTKLLFGEKGPEAARILASLASLYQRLGTFQKALECYQQSLDILKTMFGDKHLQIAPAYQNIAAVFQDLGQYKKAIDYHKQALDIRRNAYGDKHPETAKSYNHVASVYDILGEHKMALEYQYQALNISKAVYGENHKSVLNVYQELALSYESAGEYQQAFMYHNKALDLIKIIYGDSHPDIATSHNNLGLLYHKLGEHKNALEHFQKSLSITKVAFGDNHYQTASGLNNLALVERDLGQYKKALNYHKQALDIQKTKYGDQHPDIALSYNNIALVHQKLGQHQEAFEGFKKALDIWKTICGDQYPDLATCYNNLGAACRDLGQHEEAIMYLKKSLEITEAIYGEKHPSRAAACSNLAIVYQSLGEHEKALEYQKLSLSILKEIYGDKHPNIVTTYNNLGSICLNLRQPQEALMYLKKSLEIVEAVYEEKAPLRANSYAHLAIVYQSLGEHQRAFEYNERALGIFKEIYGDQHPDIATSYNNLGTICRDLGQNKEALVYLKKSLEITEAIYGEKHPYRETTYRNLGSMCMEMEHHQEALFYAKKSLKIIEAIYEEKHPLRASSYSNLAMVYLSLGEHEKSLEFYERALGILKEIEGDPDTANSYRKLGFVCQGVEKHQQAEEHFLTALNIMKSVYGNDHPNLIPFYETLAEVYEDLGQDQKAQECHNNSLRIREISSRALN